MIDLIDDDGVSKKEFVHSWGRANKSEVGWINKAEADLFAGFEAFASVDKTNGFDPLKAQFRRAEIYKRALEVAVRDCNCWIEKEYDINMFQYFKEDIDNYISIAKTEVDNGK
jgi:hypothetical protein